MFIVLFDTRYIKFDEMIYLYSMISIKMSDEYGYIYCFSNPSMPGIVKIGMTERIPEDRLSEANASDTWRPPTPYKIEFAKKVLDASRKEKILHTLLEEYTDRINSRREFFRVSPEKVRNFFDLMDGEMCVEDEEDISSVPKNLINPYTFVL
jgi:hypothetical protein